MAKRLLVSDELWELIQPILPPAPKRRFRHPGRKRLDDRACLSGILFVLKTGVPWEHLPQEMGCGSGMTCWRRLRDWQEAGVWDTLRIVLLDKLREADRIDWSRAAVDSSSIRSIGAGEKKRAKPHRSRAPGKQAPPSHRRQRDSVGRPTHRRQ